ncbi:MAG: alpha-L-fucosidase [Bacteroidales bacterium]|nr:alpha-L-fucosidase [Bacteroidales bacterium]
MSVSATKAISPFDSKDSIILKAAHVVPTANQYEALKNEFIAFIHFGPNTFTRMEWGSGKEDPSVFNLQNLDTDQWCEAMKAAGMKMVIFTAKHHDGFCLWQSRYTEHGIMSSPYMNGQGDVMKDLAVSCKKYGLKLGVYLSPADLFQIESPDGLYGNLSEYTHRVIPREVEGRPFENKTTFTFKVDDYNEYMLNQLFELLTEYGPIDEVWFDGAHPKRKGGQKYNYIAWKELIQTLAPKAVIFGRQDLRWCGNESGGTRDAEWNIIPYQDDPNQMNHFADITGEFIAQREQLYTAKYLHYQPAETNTSIREGWFYRDDTDQKVRNADDVFDIYERSVGGNSIFLLNIPPNREGKFSPKDVEVLKETGKRINETYGENLLLNAQGPANILDNDEESYVVLSEEDKTLIITVPEEITINRFLIQEAIATHSERIEECALDVWVNKEWKEVATGKNVGYKRILRFREVTGKKFRFRVLKSRFQPAISNVSAHYYQTRPPQLEISRDVNGQVSIQVKKHQFRWKPHGEDVAENLYGNFEIRFTKDGSEPSRSSDIYTEPFLLESGEINARAYMTDQTGSVASELFGVIKSNWKLLGVDSERKNHPGAMAFDGDKNTYWHSEENSPGHYLAIDLGKTYQLKGFTYSPQLAHSKGMIQKGKISTSMNGHTWTFLDDFTFGNLINDPGTRQHMFAVPVQTRYVRLEATEIAANDKSAAISEIDFLNDERN